MSISRCWTEQKWGKCAVLVHHSPSLLAIESHSHYYNGSPDLRYCVQTLCNPNLYIDGQTFDFRFAAAKRPSQDVLGQFAGSDFTTSRTLVPSTSVLFLFFHSRVRLFGEVLIRLFDKSLACLHLNGLHYQLVYSTHAIFCSTIVNRSSSHGRGKPFHVQFLTAQQEGSILNSGTQHLTIIVEYTISFLNTSCA